VGLPDHFGRGSASLASCTQYLVVRQNSIRNPRKPLLTGKETSSAAITAAAAEELRLCYLRTADSSGHTAMRQSTSVGGGCGAEREIHLAVDSLSGHQVAVILTVDYRHDYTIPSVVQSLFEDLTSPRFGADHSCSPHSLIPDKRANCQRRDGYYA
jgi:hypothetical protein